MELKPKETGLLLHRLLQQHPRVHDLKVHRAFLQDAGGEHHQHHLQPGDQQRKLSQLENSHLLESHLHREDHPLQDLRHRLLCQTLENSPIPTPNHNEPMLKVSPTQGLLLLQGRRSLQSKIHTNLGRVAPSLEYLLHSWAKGSRFLRRHLPEVQFLRHLLNERLRKETP